MTLDTYDIRLSQILCSWRAHSMQIMDHPRCQCLGQAQWTTHHQCTSSNALTFTLSEHNLARVVWVRELRVSRGTVSACHNPGTDADLLLAHPTCDWQPLKATTASWPVRLNVGVLLVASANKSVFLFFFFVFFVCLFECVVSVYGRLQCEWNRLVRPSFSICFQFSPLECTAWQHLHFNPDFCLPLAVCSILY